MMEMSREKAFERFFLLLSDLVLKPGEFDFEEASERLNCEGGEIYFLVAGHLGVMTLPEQLALAISEGQFSESESTLLQEIADPMRLLKLFAIAQQTGGEGEATKYLKGVESLMSNPAANKDALLSLASEVQAAFDVAGTRHSESESNVLSLLTEPWSCRHKRRTMSSMPYRRCIVEYL